jgi:hypothetical protein
MPAYSITYSSIAYTRSLVDASQKAIRASREILAQPVYPFTHGAPTPPPPPGRSGRGRGQPAADTPAAQDFGVSSGREARKAARSAAVSTLARF